MVSGYMGKLLRVDLSSGKISEEQLPDESVLRKYIGCYGLGLKLLYDLLLPGTSAHDAENPMIFLTGPLTGTRAPGATNLTLITKNGDTDFTASRSHTHGLFGPNLKFAGYDGIIITGKSAEPVYLWISDERVELRDATHLWGKDTHETEDLVKDDLNEPKASVAAIGPAGENLCAGALIENDYNHSMAHGGTGSVMGSKKLKAIAVYGHMDVPVFDNELAKAIAREWRGTLNYGPDSPMARLGRGGVPRGDYKGIKSIYGLCVKNLQTTELEGFGDGWSQQKITPRPCWGCPIACPYDLEILEGPRKGYIASLCGGGEGMEGSSSIFGISNLGDVFYLIDLYDRLGIEGSTAGCTIAMAFEAYEKGLITKEDTDGLELKWGDVAVVEKMIRKYVTRDGFGDVLARGPKAAAEFIGGDAPNFAVHIKGAGMNLHDWRRGWGVLLGQIVGAGSGWPAPGADLTRPDPDSGYPERTAPFNAGEKPLEVRRTGITKYAVDSTGVCWFNTWGNLQGTELSAKMIAAVTGWDFTRDELLEFGERMLNFERVFNIRHGLTVEDDYKVSERLIEGQKDGPFTGHPVKPYLKGMINEYYRLMGWDGKTGKPWRNTLKRVDLGELVSDVWG
ncbi:aldehyde ferredoxin oxidoreductase family protein [Chloroflexota bacterium]